jgi:hypothetical protein
LLNNKQHSGYQQTNNTSSTHFDLNPKQALQLLTTLNHLVCQQKYTSFDLNFNQALILNKPSALYFNQ